ncbi:MAG: MBL fold metallo-hydrolase [Chloroflexi bacterium]|nr:MAG: MBL fold metallo-hydrolase [Chloroflexota bacterium]
MKITMWGTRGSLADAGPQTVRYGGNTACVEVRGRDGSILVLDAGTGIRRLGGSLGTGWKRVDILLTHLHMDHIQGLGFFGPLYQAGAEVHIWGPPSPTEDLRSRLGRYMSPPLFPVLIRDLPCELTIHDAPRGSFRIGELEIAADLVCHPGPTVGFRIDEGGTSICYLPDHEPALGVHDFPQEPDWTSGYDLAVGCQLLIHDAQYSEEEYSAYQGWGHSSIEQAVAFATLAGVQKMVTFHHDPSHDDAALDQLVEGVRRNVQLPFSLIAGTEGAAFEIGE